MKKTIVAAAVAALVAAPAAFADVSISGNIFAESGDNNGEQDEVFTDVFFKASEDLGNGMKASTVIQYVSDNGGVATTASADDNRGVWGGNMHVTLSGDFGSIQMGQMESYIEQSVNALMAVDPAHTITIEQSVGEGGMDRGTRYTSPSFSGAKVVVERFAAGETGAAVVYSNGGLSAQYAVESGSTATEEVASYSVQYKMGDMMARIVGTEDDAGDEATYVGATYTMGANTLGVDVITDAKGTIAANDGDYTVSLKHSLSKNTSVYLAHMNNDDGDDETVVGIRQNF
jgi:hypothetical protein